MALGIPSLHIVPPAFTALCSLASPCALPTSPQWTVLYHRRWELLAQFPELTITHLYPVSCLSPGSVRHHRHSLSPTIPPLSMSWYLQPEYLKQLLFITVCSTRDLSPSALFLMLLFVCFYMSFIPLYVTYTFGINASLKAYDCSSVQI